MAAPLDTHRLAAGGPIEGLSDRRPPVDNDRILVAIPHPETPDVEPLAGAGGVDPAEDQERSPRLSWVKRLTAPSTIDSRSWRCCSVPPRCGSYPCVTRAARSRLVETGVGPVEMGLLGIEFGVTFRHETPSRGHPMLPACRRDPTVQGAVRRGVSVAFDHGLDRHGLQCWWRKGRPLPQRRHRCDRRAHQLRQSQCRTRGRHICGLVHRHRTAGGALPDRRRSPPPRSRTQRRGHRHRRADRHAPCRTRGRAQPAAVRTSHDPQRRCSRRGRSTRPASSTACCPRGARRLDRARIDELLPDGWPKRPTWIVAVRTNDGRRIVFGRDDVTGTVGQATQASSRSPPSTRRFASGSFLRRRGTPLVDQRRSGRHARVRPRDRLVGQDRHPDARSWRSDPERAWFSNKLDNELAEIRSTGTPAIVIEPDDRNSSCLRPGTSRRLCCRSSGGRACPRHERRRRSSDRSSNRPAESAATARRRAVRNRGVDHLECTWGSRARR